MYEGRDYLNLDKLIKTHESRNPIIIAKALGIIILYEDLGTTNGFYNTAFRYRFIHVNQNLSENEQIYTIAHELGHAILHPHLNTQFLKDCTHFLVSKYEKEANQFALNLLISDEELMKNMDCSISQLCSLFDINQNLMKLRLQSFKVCSR